MGLRDLVLFFLATGLSLRWIAAAASAGPSSLVVWLFAATAFFLPLALSVLELSSRFPEEGGMYLWSKRTIGDGAAFQTGWLYWASNLPYFPAILYFTAGNALYIVGGRALALANSPLYFILFSVIALALATALNIVGLRIGKWLQNVGGVGTWLPIALLLVLAGIAVARSGSATDFTPASFVPDVHPSRLAFWSNIVFAMAGAEASSFMVGDVRDPRRTLPRGVLIGGALVVTGYMLGTVAMLLVLSPNEISGIAGIMQAIERGTARLGASWLVPVFALLITLSNLGAVGAWLVATARLPFVCGLDGYLPRSIGRLHPRWATPHVALLWMFGLAVLFVFLGQAGTSVKGAYDVLVSMTTISYFIPYLYGFVALIRAQKLPIPPDAITIPGGPRVAIAVAIVGMCTTSATILLAMLPSPDEPRKALAVLKIVGLTGLMIAAGYGLYWAGRRRIAASRGAQ